MIRHLARLPATYSLAQLKEAARSRFPSLIDVNTVEKDGNPHLAVYLPDGNTTDPATWVESVAGHVPSTPTPEDQAAAETANRATIEQQALAALAHNKAWLAAAKPATAAAQASSAYDQTKALTRQMNGVIRLLLGRFDGAD